MSRGACAACAADRARGVGQSASAAVACARLRSTRPQWWEREPGYFADELAAIRRANRRPPPPPLPALPKIKALSEYTPRELAAELAKQSKRLAAAQVGDFSGPKAAEDWVAFRREQLGFNLHKVAA